MTNPLVNAFFLGRALAEGINEKVEAAVSSALSELGKFDAEQRENLRNFTEQVQARAQQDASQTHSSQGSGTVVSPVDLQETIDNLRAEVAQLRASLQVHRNQN
jgi:vacuolar-type H+-ATPase subunit E/Vma4